MEKLICKYCGKSMEFLDTYPTYYLYSCFNYKCKNWHTGVEVPKTKLAKKLSQPSP